MTDDEPTADEQAVTALLAALVQDSPPSQVSPPQVVKLAKAQTRVAHDRRVTRLKWGRNALVAAAIIAVIAVVVPHLGISSDNSASTASSASSAASASAAAAPAAAAGSAAKSQDSGGGSAGAGSAATSAAASSGSPRAGAAPAPAAGSSAAGGPLSASSAPAGSAAGAAGPDSTDQNFGSAGGGGCPLLPTAAQAAARAAFPAGYFGAAVPVAGCAVRFGATLAAGAGHQADLTIVVAAAAVGACRAAGPTGPACSPVPGTTDAYQRTASDGTSVWVYGGGYQVTLSPSAGGLSATQLVAAGRAVIKTIG